MPQLTGAASRNLVDNAIVASGDVGRDFAGGACGRPDVPLGSRDAFLGKGYIRSWSMSTAIPSLSGSHCPYRLPAPRPWWTAWGCSPRLLVGRSTDCATIIAISHSWDETKQMLRGPARHHLARQGTQNISRNAIVQKVLLHTTAVLAEPEGRELEHPRSETVAIPPLELHGKGTDFVLVALRKGSALRFFDNVAPKWVLEKAAAIIMSYWGDVSSPTRNALRHIASLTEDPGWPAGALVDVGASLLPTPTASDQGAHG